MSINKHQIRTPVVPQAQRPLYQCRQLLRAVHIGEMHINVDAQQDTMIISNNCFLTETVVELMFRLEKKLTIFLTHIS